MCDNAMGLPNWACLVEMQFGIDVLSFFPKNSNSFRCFQSDREFIPDAATEKACLPKLSFVLGTISCEIDDRQSTTCVKLCSVFFRKW